MRKTLPIFLGISIAVAGSLMAAAQETASVPKVLELQREFIKAGKSGNIHDKSESNFVQAMERAKWPTHYIALNSMSGKSRALYLTGYDSFTAWEKDNDAVAKNAELSATIDRSEMSDGELLDGVDSAAFYYREDQSFHPRPDLSHQRYLELMSYRLRPGHHAEWSEMMKMVVAADEKAGTNANFATYELEYGGAEQYLIISGDTSLSEIDGGFADGKKFEAAMGEDGMKKLDELMAAAVESVDSELFAINPKQSYPPEEWVKANPEFWKPKPMTAMAKPAAAMKPAQ